MSRYNLFCINLTCWHQTKGDVFALKFPSSTTINVSAITHNQSRIWGLSSLWTPSPSDWLEPVFSTDCLDMWEEIANARPAKANTELPWTEGLPLEKREIIYFFIGGFGCRQMCTMGLTPTPTPLDITYREADCNCSVNLSRVLQQRIKIYTIHYTIVVIVYL